MKTQMMLGTIALIGMALYAGAAEKRSYPCHRLAQPPALDGKLDDEAWKNIPEATGFYIFGGGAGKYGKYALEKQTFFKAGWTEDALYLAVRAEENMPEKLKASPKDGGAIWTDDSIEVFFLPPGAPNYTQLVANSAGRRSNIREDEIKNVMDWEAQAVVEKTEWRLELRIPFATLTAKAPKEGDEWPVNIGRNTRTGPAGERFTSWPLLRTGFNDVPNFGRFVFKGAAGDKVADEEEKLNGAYLRDIHGEIKELAGLAGKYEQGLAGAQKMETLRVEAEKLRQVWEQVVKAANAQQPDRQQLQAALRASIDLQQKSSDCIDHGMLEALFKE